MDHLFIVRGKDFQLASDSIENLAVRFVESHHLDNDIRQIVKSLASIEVKNRKKELAIRTQDHMKKRFLEFKVSLNGCEASDIGQCLHIITCSKIIRYIIQHYPQTFSPIVVDTPRLAPINPPLIDWTAIKNFFKGK